MGLFCRISIKTVQTESMKAAIEMWRERWAGVVLTQDINGSEDGGDENEPEPGRKVAGIWLC